jgi:hypothetical protein
MHIVLCYLGTHQWFATGLGRPSAPITREIGQDRVRMYVERHEYHEKRNSLRTGEPANSGFSKTQLKIVRGTIASAGK